MSAYHRIFLAAVLFSLCACAQKSPTPENVSTRYHDMLDTLDANAPGASVRVLEAFRAENQTYDVVDSVDYQIAARRGAMHGRYAQARELARDGDFARAEDMLQDLALAPGTEDGASAKQHLEFAFYLEKTKWLLVRQRFEEAEAVARMLQARDLDRFQRDQVEQVLDYVSNVDGAMQMGEQAKAQSACRQLIVLLASVFAEEGRYPETFALADVERLGSGGAFLITNQLSSIEDYRTWDDKYALTAVAKNGERFKIVNGTIEE